jgi:hypothetical protein
MEMQAEAERRKRALILDSQGEQEAEVNLATGKKLAAVLASEATMTERINIGKGEASAIEAHAHVRKRRPPPAHLPPTSRPPPAAGPTSVGRCRLTRSSRLRGQASAKAVRVVAAALRAEGGVDAGSLRIAEQYAPAFKALAAHALSLTHSFTPSRSHPLAQPSRSHPPFHAHLVHRYVSAFKALAASGSTVIVPANAADVGGMVAQAMAVYRATSRQPSGGRGGSGASGSAPAALLDEELLGEAQELASQSGDAAELSPSDFPDPSSGKGGK